MPLSSHFYSRDKYSKIKLQSRVHGVGLLALLAEALDDFSGVVLVEPEWPDDFIDFVLLEPEKVPLTRAIGKQISMRE